MNDFCLNLINKTLKALNIMKKIQETLQTVIGWLSKKFDKTLHFTASMVITLYALTFLPTLAGIAVAAAIGATKEWYDSKQEGNSWSWGDIIADVAGIITAAVPLFLIQP